MFIFARVDRWSAAARLLIGTPASLPVSHPHIDAPSTCAGQPPAASPRPSAFLSSSPMCCASLSCSCFPCARCPPSPRPSFLSSPLVSSSCSSSSLFLVLYSLSSPLISPFVVIFVLSVSPRSCLRLPIIFPRTPRARRAAFFVFSSMSTNNSLPFYPYFLFRFSPAYSRTAESPLFPHTYIYALALLSFLYSSSKLLRFLPLFPTTLIKAAVSKPIARALVLYLSCTRSLVCASARWRVFPMRAAFSPAALIVDGAMRRTRVGRLSRRSRNGNFNT